MALSQWKEAILEGIFIEIEEGVVEEKNLERLENLVEIIHKEGSKVPESVKEAYCLVAVECTAKCLGYEEDSKEAFIDAVRRIWFRRIMPLCDKVSCLVTRDLLDSCKRLWKAHNDEVACESVMEENTRDNALVALRKVVSELHPNLDNVVDDGNEYMDESDEVETSEESGETEPVVEGREIEVYRNPEVSQDVDDEQESLSDTEAERPSEAKPARRKMKSVPTPEFNRVLGDLRTSKLELVKALEAGGGPSNINNEMITEQENDVDNPSAANTTPKPSLMERKSTAQAYEWEDSIDDSDGEMAGDGERNAKSRRKSKRIAVSPFKRNQSSKSARRPKLAWSTAETLAVMQGYEKYGTNWKLIKEENPVLVRRTNGDLKDKFRVEMRRIEKERHP